MTPADFLASLLPARLEPTAQGKAYAPANIALAKYWGKRDRALNLPVNGSLSISLGGLGTHTTVRAANRDRITLNGSDAAPGSALHRRTFAFIELWRRGAAQPLHIETENTIPTAAGLASSASGFAALARALACDESTIRAQLAELQTRGIVPLEETAAGWQIRPALDLLDPAQSATS